MAGRRLSSGSLGSQRSESEKLQALMESRATRDPVVLQRVQSLHETIHWGDRSSYDWLISSIKGGHISAMSYIWNGNSFNPDQSFDALNLCITKELWDLAKIIKDSGVPWHSPDKSDDVIHTAVLTRNVDLVGKILDQKGDGGFVAPDGSTLLHVSVTQQDPMMTEFLLDSTREHPAKIDFKRVDREKRTALSIAVSLGNREIVQILLADGRSDLGRAREDGMIPLHIAISFNRCELVMMLLAYGSPYIRTDRSGLTSMHLAAGLGHRGILSALWARHDPKTILPDSGVTKETPAFIAVKRNDLDTYKLLRTMDYQAEKTNASGETCLYLAVYLGFEDFVQYMIEMKDNLDQLLCVEYRTRTSEPTRVSETVLMTAVARNRPSMLTLLLKGKADPDKQNDEGKTALMIAVKYGFAHLVTILVNYLAKLMIVDKQGYNAITLAVKSNNYEVIDALTAKRPNLNVLDAVRGAPLHYAVRHSNAHVVQLLLKRGALPDTANQHGVTPRDLAKKYGHPKVLAEFAKWDQKEHRRLMRSKKAKIVVPSTSAAAAAAAATDGSEVEMRSSSDSE